jgi:hypothetical protein
MEGMELGQNGGGGKQTVGNELYLLAFRALQDIVMNFRKSVWDKEAAEIIGPSWIWQNQEGSMAN